MEKATWVLVDDDLGVPILLSKDVNVLRLQSNRGTVSLRRYLAFVQEWDRRRSAEEFDGELCEEKIVTSTGEIAGQSLNGDIVSAHSLEFAQELSRNLNRSTYYISLNGEGLSRRWRREIGWLADGIGARTTLSCVNPPGLVSEVLTLEQRGRLSSPAITQQQCLRAAGALVASVQTSFASRTERHTGASPVQEQGARKPVDRVSISDIARVSAAIVSRTILARARTRAVAKWEIAVHVAEAPVSSGKRNMSELLSGKPAFELRRPKQDYVADPFLVSIDSRTFILAEEHLSDVGRGRIVSQEIGGNGRPVGECRVVLETPYHLSFPTVITDSKDPQSFYLLAEQASSGAVILYRGNLEAPDNSMRFTEHETLLHMPGIDPVLLNFGGWWYLFVTDGSYGNIDNNLSLYYSTSLAGPFRVHPASPIRSGLRGSRMAGGIIQEGSSLFRLGQDNRHRYGGSIVVFEIARLSTEQYEEREVMVVAPPRENGAVRGIHTLNVSGHLLALDKLVSRV